MNREHWKAVLPYVQAFADGERVEWQNSLGAWIEMIDFSFIDPADRYRIVPKPKLRPWRVNEVPLGKEVVRADGSRMTLHTAYNNTINGYEYSTLLRDWTLADGSPCGVEEST